tara:strand:- start:29788 stop:30411 length:624 start_codon:yes stop_codon:yes gene_type:complete
MAIIKPTSKGSSGGGNFYGICDIEVLGFNDKSSNFEWADIYLEVIVKQKGSDYTKTIRLAGSLERDPDGSVKGGSVLNRLYHFFDVLGCSCGINAQGKWETEDGQPIDDIAKYLTDKHSIGFNSEPTNFPYLAYVYKEKPKQVGGKVFTRVHHKINVNTEEGRRKLADDIKWFKDKGFIKEASLEQSSHASKEELDEVFGNDTLGNM